MSSHHNTYAEQVLHYFTRPHTEIPGAPITGESAWIGSEMAAADDWHTTLTSAEVAELDAALAVAMESDRAMVDLTEADFPLDTLAGRVAEWRHDVADGRGFVLIRGFPVDRWSELECEVAFWCLGMHLGRPGEQSDRHDLLGHVRDTRNPADASGRQYRTNQDIPFHCDAADVVGLLCLHPSKEGGLSRLVSSVSVFNELLETRPDLAEHLFELWNLDGRSDDPDPALQYAPIQPCCFDGKTLRTFMHTGYFRSVERHGVDVPAITHQTIEAWEAIAERPGMYLDMDFGPGDMQLLSNHTITHARTGYTDFDDPAQRRHLLRLWLSL